jgi:outer membrane protein OmpA-like peptidoglycan-associated protein
VAVAAPAELAEAAIETSGDFSADACAGRFEIISRTDAVCYACGSAVLDETNRPLLDSVIAIVERCPGLSILVAGDADSVGPDELAQTRSEARARAVTDYLQGRGVPSARLPSIGYGEQHPVVPNDPAWNRSRNRRVELLVAESG